MHAIRGKAWLLAPLVLAACATQDKPRDNVGMSEARQKQVTEAVQTPLTDLNVVRAEIPAILKSAQSAPYAMPKDKSCATLAEEVRALDGALGADLDTPVTNANPSLIDRGSDAAGDAAVRAVRGAAEGVIPYRGWVRRLSGAERYAKQVSSAIAAGTIRRSFLKGLGEAGGCEAPAAPRR
jgi:hypothetical protein